MAAIEKPTIQTKAMLLATMKNAQRQYLRAAAFVISPALWVIRVKWAKIESRKTK